MDDRTRTTRGAVGTDDAVDRRDGVDDRERLGARVAPTRAGVAPGRSEVVGRQHDEFGGIAWGSTFFGWLTSAGLTGILAGILGATGAALAINKVGNKVSGGEAKTIGLAGGIGLLVILAIAYFCGGYVAGRMARFDGARQGVGVWVWGIIVAAVIAALAAIGGSQYNVLDALNLPRIPVSSGTLTTGGIIALVAALVITLLTAVLGGKMGERFHRKVDRVGYREV